MTLSAGFETVSAQTGISQEALGFASMVVVGFGGLACAMVLGKTADGDPIQLLAALVITLLVPVLVQYLRLASDPEATA